MSFSRFADDSVEIPDSIRQLAGPEPITPVWVNGDGGVTFQLGVGPARRFAKWVLPAFAPELAAEVDRMRWALSFARVPTVLDAGEDPAGAWLLTTGLPGESAITDRWKARPEHAIRVAASALRQLHDALPVESCPFGWSVSSRLATDPSRVTDDLLDPPAIDRYVVCHGDACVPNTLITDQGAFSGHVDLGSLGTADRWADLAVATWSTEWNYGPGWEDVYLSAYGIEPDEIRSTYYRQLWALGHPD